MRIVTNTVTVHTEGYTYAKERSASIRRVDVNYEYVRTPVAVQRPIIEDVTSLVVVHEKMEYYS